LVFTPLLGYLLFRSRPTRDHMTGLVVAIGGFALLSYPQTGESFNWGDILILFAAVSWAALIAATSAFASESDVRTLAAAQVMVVAALSLSTGLPDPLPILNRSRLCWRWRRGRIRSTGASPRRWRTWLLS